MDENTRANIESNARHAIVEIEGMLGRLDKPETIWDAFRAASSRLGYIGELLQEAGYTPPRS